MKKTYLILIIFSLVILVSCKAKEPIVNTVYVNHTVKEILRDTIIDVQIKQMYVVKQTKDTLSELRTNNAYSRAFWSDGILFHSLEQKGVQPTNVVFKDKIIIDTIYKSEILTKTVEKELSWWQKLFIGSGKILFALAGCCLLFFIGKFALKKYI